MKKHQHSISTPSQFLIENVDLLPVGRVIDLAMGRGRNAVYLARMGFDVEGIDISPEAVSSAVELAEKSGVYLKAKAADMEDNFLIEAEAYDVVICFNYLQRSLISGIKKALRVGGMVVYETYIVDQARFGKPRNPDYLLKHNELLHMFQDFRCLRYREGIVEGRKAVASLVAQKIVV